MLPSYLDLRMVLVSLVCLLAKYGTNGCIRGLKEWKEAMGEVYVEQGCAGGMALSHFHSPINLSRPRSNGRWGLV